MAVLSLLWAAQRAVAADPPPPPGAALYAQNCAACHDHPKDRIPPKEKLAKRTPEEVVMALTTGTMRVQAGGLNHNDQVALATYLTGRVPSDNPVMPPEKNLCAKGARFEPAASPTGQWNGWGVDLDNSRYQPKPGLDAKDLPKLKLKWAFGYHGSSVYGQPTVVGGRVYVTSVTGRVYSLDAGTGCTYWTYDAQAPSRTAMSVDRVSSGGTAKTTAVFFGDDAATVYALNAADGKLLWKQRLDPHVSARISGAPVAHEGKLYVPVSSLEELAAVAPGYPCCTFRGSVAALQTSDGKVLWQTYTIDKKAAPSRKAKDGTQLYGPAGVAVWSAPTLDPKRRALYVGTGNSYTDETAPHANSILAMSMETGRVLWANQVRTQDNYIVGCDLAPVGPCEEGKACPKGPANCPAPVGPDVDLGTSPILRTLSDGRQVLMTGQKSGEVHALDPQTGRQVRWHESVPAARWAASNGVRRPMPRRCTPRCRMSGSRPARGRVALPPYALPTASRCGGLRRRSPSVAGARGAAPLRSPRLSR